ncbi:hypothetical protein [Novosphingobium terrae]|uniref:hypothetical protein n=1 Tax=Novosphingobium terrae TaxID=2726189 RepID=UPI001F1309CE|nr:hypothetical protein [Novosphingobium terrae]
MTYQIVPDLHMAPGQDPGLRDIVLAKLENAEIPGLSVTFQPDEAGLAGAFLEDALGVDDALNAEDGFGDYAVTGGR